MAQAQNTSVSLGDHFAEFIATSVKEGRYSSASDVVRAGLRLLEEQETRLRSLRQAIEDGIQSGFPDDPFDSDAFLRQMREKHGASA